MGSESIVGVWTLRSFESEDADTKAIERPLGERPLGHLFFTAGGHMSAIGIAAHRQPLDVGNPTDVERATLFKSMFSYSGKYRIDGGMIVHDVEASWRGDWNGTTQIRFAEISGSTLTVKTAPFRNPRDGRMCVVTAIWERAE